MNPKVSVLFLLIVSACGAHSAGSAKSTTGEANPEAQRALTPNESLGPETKGPRLIATLDKAIGPQFSKDGERFTATVGPGSAIPEGSRLVGQVVEVQPAMAGTMAFVVLAVSGIERDGKVEWLDARVASVELSESQAGGREVNSTGAPSSEVIGSVIPQSKVPDSDAMNRDPLGRGTVIALGSGSESHHLPKGTRIVVQMRAAAGADSAPPVQTLKEIATGRSIRLSDVPVESVIGDVVFWVGKDKSERSLVVMAQVLDIPETRTIVKTGMRVSIEGHAEPMPTAAEAPRLWKLVTKSEGEAMQGHAYYIYATRVRTLK